MKRFIVLMMMSLVVLVGCAADQIKESTDKFVSEVKDMKLAENSKISSELREKLISERESVLNKVADALELEGSRNLLENHEFNKLKESLMEYQVQLEYKVESVDLNSEKTEANATISVDYFDIGELAKTSLNDALDRSLSRAGSRDEISTEDFLNGVFSSMNESLESWDSEGYRVTKKAELTIVELEGDWIIDKIDDNLLNAITLGVHGSLNDGLEEKLETIVDNRRFLLVESNLITSFNEIVVSSDVDETLIYYSKVEEDKDDLISRISDRIDGKVKWGEKGAQDGVYYIYKDKEKNEIVVQVNVDGEEYKLSKELADE